MKKLRDGKFYLKVFKNFVICFIYLFVSIFLFESELEDMFGGRLENYVFMAIFISVFIIYYIIVNFIINKIFNYFGSEERMLKMLDMYYSDSKPKYEKYLFYRRAIISNVKQIYYVSNKDGQVYYKVYLEKIMPNEYVIENYNRENIARIKTKLLSGIDLRCTIELKNGKEIEFNRSIKDGLCYWTMDGVEYVIESSDVYTQYNRVMIGDKKIADIDVNNIDDGSLLGNYDIILYEDKKDMEVIVVALNLCMLINSNSYRSSFDNN